MEDTKIELNKKIYIYILHVNKWTVHVKVYKVEENSSCALPKVAAPSTLPCCPLQPPPKAR